jgi:hypothetical protein
MAKKNLTKTELVDTSIKLGMRDNVVIEKGIVLNEDYLLSNFSEIGDMMSIFSAYPDLFLYLITPSDSSFKLYFY